MGSYVQSTFGNGEAVGKNVAVQGVAEVGSSRKKARTSEHVERVEGMELFVSDRELSIVNDFVDKWWCEFCLYRYSSVMLLDFNK